jgi:hypothetical protein
VKPILNAALVAAALLAVPMGVMAQPPNAPFAGQAKMTCGQALKEVPKDDTELAPLAKSFDADAARLKKSPKDAKVKKAYVDSAVKYEQKIYVGANKLSPTVKYRSTLALCRVVLAVDPKNPTCKKDMGQIVDIYTNSMHVPIPQ